MAYLYYEHLHFEDHWSDIFKSKKTYLHKSACKTSCNGSWTLSTNLLGEIVIEKFLAWWCICAAEQRLTRVHWFSNAQSTPGRNSELWLCVRTLSIEKVIHSSRQFNPWNVCNLYKQQQQTTYCPKHQFGYFLCLPLDYNGGHKTRYLFSRINIF